MLHFKNLIPGITAMTKAEIVAPFVASFTSSDPTKGGCPNAHTDMTLDEIVAAAKKGPEIAAEEEEEEEDKEEKEEKADMLDVRISLW